MGRESARRRAGYEKSLMENPVKEGPGGVDFSYPSMNAFMLTGKRERHRPSGRMTARKSQLAGPMSQKILQKLDFPEKGKRRFREKNNGGVNSSSHLGGVCLREKPELLLIVFS
jgi:hypothetical protein